MYKPEERKQLLNETVLFINSAFCFEGLLQIGSGAVGFSDIYSDIDLMAGCYNLDCVKHADSLLFDFFTNSGACHIEKHIWTSSVLGMSAYFENGLSVDISFMPTSELPIRSPLQKIIFSKTENFINMVNAGIEKFEQQTVPYGLDNSIHFRFINELRYVEIAILRKQFIFADISLNNARQLLLAVETVSEGKKLHQFKAYDTLSEIFLQKLKNTYPQNLSAEKINTAKNNLLLLYLETVKNSNYLIFDRTLLKLLGCFE